MERIDAIIRLNMSVCFITMTFLVKRAYNMDKNEWIEMYSKNPIYMNFSLDKKNPEVCLQ